MTNQTAESARALLYRHGLPEDVIDGALALHAQELAAVQRQEADDLHQTEPGVVKGLRIGADLIDPTKAASSAGRVPATDQAALRDRIARWEQAAWAAGRTVDRNALAVYMDVADQERAAVLREAADRLDAMLAQLFADWPSELRNSPGVRSWKEATTELRRMADETQPAETVVTVQHAPGKAIRCPDCRAKGYTVCLNEPPMDPMHILGIDADETRSESCAHCGQPISRITGTLAAWWVHDPGGNTVCHPEQAASSTRATPKAAAEAQQDGAQSAPPA